MALYNLKFLENRNIINYLKEKMKDINIAFITERMIRGHGVDLVVDRLADGLGKKRIPYKGILQLFR